MKTTPTKSLSKMILISLCLFGLSAGTLGCMQVDPDAVAANEKNNKNPDKDAKPDENGRLNLTSESLIFNSIDDNSQPNRFYIQTLSKVNSVVKEYYFSVTNSQDRYSLNFNEVIGTSCSTSPYGKFFIVNNNNNGYIPVSPFQNFGLTAGNYRLQFRVENLNCLAITVGFGLKKF